MTKVVEYQIDETKEETGFMEQKICLDLTKRVPWIRLVKTDENDKKNDR